MVKVQKQNKVEKVIKQFEVALQNLRTKNKVFVTQRFRMNSNESGYIQLSNDRSHLIEQIIETKTQYQKALFDIYDLVMILTNVILIAYIIFNYLKNKKSTELNYDKQIHIPINEKTSGEFPFFQTFKKKPRNPVPKKTQTKENIPNAGQNQATASGHNIIELKCTKCSYTTEIYQKNILSTV